MEFSDADQVVKIENVSDEKPLENEPARRILTVFPTATNRPYMIYQENNRRFEIFLENERFRTGFPGVVHLKMICMRGRCRFTHYLRSVITCDPNSPEYFTPENWRFVPLAGGDLLCRPHTCPGRRIGAVTRLTQIGRSVARNNLLK